MNCRDCQNNLSDYVDARLDDALRERVDAHRRSCQACGQAYLLMQRAGVVLAGEGPAQPDPGLAERAARAAFAAGQRAPARSFFERWIPVAWPVTAVAAAAAVLLVVTSPPAASRGAASAVVDPLSLVMDDDGADFDGDVLGVETAVVETANEK